MAKKVCVLLSGCGVFDGSEIHESVATLLALSRAGAEYILVAPDRDQHHVINHLDGSEMNETRNIRIESARIARGNVLATADVSVDDFDALFLPGGFGAAKNFCSFAFEGANASIEADIQHLIQSFHNANKPIGAVCIAPAVLALCLGKGTLTIGSDPATAEALEKLGATHTVCPVTEMVIDLEHNFVTAPAYMEDAPIHQVAEGIEKAVNAVLSLCT
jgi:enhancing lycopene biosynthesis protein 2